MTDDGKAVFDDVYNRDDARGYYRTLGALDYRIPQYGADIVGDLIDTCFPETNPTVLDVCCSYGVAGALLKTDLDLDDLYKHYDALPASASRADVLRADAALLAGHRRPDAPTVVGLDIADQAIRYAVESTALDGGFTENLETDRASDALVDRLHDVDLIMTTGGVGYVTEKTFDALLSGADRTPWVAAFCLRAYDYQPIIDCLDEHGLQTETTERHFPQRRFADAEEKHWAIEQVRDNDLEPRGLETDGYYYADFFLSRDPASIARRPLESLLAG